MNRLRACTIEDFGLIVRARVVLSNGLTVFSGETGSGKTMLLGALRFALGERTAGDLVRGGAARARVTLEIEPDDTLRARLVEDGFHFDAGEDAIFARDLQPGGKSSGRINGRAATGAQVREYAEVLVDVVGQHEQLRLLSSPYQTEILDRSAGASALAERERVAGLYARERVLGRELDELTASAGRALAEAEFARFAVDEIDAAKLSADEETALRERREYLANAQRIALALQAAHDALAGGDGGAGDALGSAAGALNALAGFSPRLRELSERAAAAQSEAAELAQAVARESESAEFDPAENDEIGTRLDVIARLLKKYGGSVASAHEMREQFSATVAGYESRDERIADLRAERARVASSLRESAGRLTAARSAAASELNQRVAGELAALAMPGATFKATLETLEEIGARGAERVEFALSPNPGEPARPLARAASGGELSRVLLALVVVLADRRDPTTLVFDEVDAGIGGATAAAVGVRLGEVARRVQVLCVTHLAQIASWADAHYALRKRDGATTMIEVVQLEAQPVVTEEIARMLSGTSTAVAREHAAALLDHAGTQKRSVAKKPNLRETKPVARAVRRTRG